MRDSSVFRLCMWLPCNLAKLPAAFKAPLASGTEQGDDGLEGAAESDVVPLLGPRGSLVTGLASDVDLMQSLFDTSGAVAVAAAAKQETTLGEKGEDADAVEVTGFKKLANRVAA